MTGPYDYVAPSYWLEDRQHGGAYGFNTETSPGPAIPVIESMREMLPTDNSGLSTRLGSSTPAAVSFKTFNIFNRALDGGYGDAHRARGLRGEEPAHDLRGRARHVRGLQPEQVQVHRRDPVDAEQRLALDDLAPL